MLQDPGDPIETILNRTERWAKENIESRRPRNPQFGFACYVYPLDVLRIIEECRRKLRIGRIRKLAKICVICGTSFSNYSHTRVKTCSPACLSQLGRLNQRKRRPADDPGRIGTEPIVRRPNPPW